MKSIMRHSRRGAVALAFLTGILWAGYAAGQSASLPAKPTTASWSAGDDLVVQGKLVFEETAGGVGCAYCHGLDARGNTEIGAPFIIGAPEAQVLGAFVRVDMMSFIALNQTEVAAVVTYLQYLNEQR